MTRGTALLFRGAFTALVTPFRNGHVDENALRELVDFQIRDGIDGLVPCGTTGESVTLHADEHERVIRIVVEEAKGRVPVVAGVGTVSTSHTIELAKAAQRAKADALLVVMPYYNRPTQAGLVAHVGAVLAEVSMPTMLYNIPGRCGVDLSVDSLGQLERHREVVAIKEATGNILRSQEIAARFGDRFAVMSGDDALTLGVLAVGGTGVVSVTSNVLPGAVAQTVKLFESGDVAAARVLHRKLLPVHEAMFVESNPGPVKAALVAMGKLAPEIRLPLVWPTEASVGRIHQALRGYGALK